MKVTPEFLTAKNSKELSCMCISKFSRNNENKEIMYLCLNVKIPYTDKKELVFVETDAKIEIENYSGFGDSSKTIPINAFHFNCAAYLTTPNFIVNFLNQIKKDSEIRFKIVAYNSSNMLISLNLVSHQLYGYINDKEYFLNSYTGLNNSASPVN
jgi:hypothetical protein